MQLGAKRLTARAAVFVIALQAFLTGFAAWPPPSYDPPTTFICHSAPPDADRQAPLPASHDDCCAQCILCSALTMPGLAAADATAMPPRAVTAKLVPFSAAAPFAYGRPNPNLPRGPPASA